MIVYVVIQDIEHGENSIMGIFTEPQDADYMKEALSDMNFTSDVEYRVEMHEVA